MCAAQVPDGVVEKVIANGDPPPSSELDLGVRGVLRRLRSFEVMPEGGLSRRLICLAALQPNQLHICALARTLARG